MELYIIIIVSLILFALARDLFHYGKRSRSLKGEWVKSRAEKLIADYFFRNGIAYQYEKSRVGLKPDFYLTEFGIYVEYWGLANVSSL